MSADDQAEETSPRVEVSAPAGPPRHREPPEIGAVVWWQGQRATVLDVADYPLGICQVVIRLDRPAGRPPVSLRLEELDRTGPSLPMSEPPGAGGEERPIRKR